MIRIAHAAASNAEFAAQCFVNKINQAILFPVITLLLALAFLVFLYGMFEYVKNAASDQGRETGKQHILYGVIGMFVMLSAYSILSLAAGTFGIGLFNSDQIVCGAGASPAVSTATPGFGAGGGFAPPGGVFDSPGGVFGGGILPGGEDPVLPPMQPAPLVDPLPSPDAPVIDTLSPCPPWQPVRFEDGSCGGSPAVGVSGVVPVWGQEHINQYLSYDIHTNDSSATVKEEILNDPEWDGATQVLYTIPLYGDQTYVGPAEVLCENVTGISGNNLNIDRDRSVYVCFNYEN